MSSLHKLKQEIEKIKNKHNKDLSTMKYQYGIKAIEDTQKNIIKNYQL